VLLTKKKKKKHSLGLAFLAEFPDLVLDTTGIVGAVGIKYEQTRVVAHHAQNLGAGQLNHLFLQSAETKYTEMAPRGRHTAEFSRTRHRQNFFFFGYRELPIGKSIQVKGAEKQLGIHFLVQCVIVVIVVVVLLFVVCSIWIRCKQRAGF
jgi:hypothetical protein